MKSIITAFLILFASSTIFATSLWSGFEGKWKVVDIEIIDETSPWIQDSFLPVQIEINMQGSNLLARFTEKSGFTCQYSNALEVIEGAEMVLIGCRPIKSTEIFSPIHRIKLKDNCIEALVITDKPIYKWTAEKAE